MKLIAYIKKEIVLTIAVVLAVVSAVAVPPDRMYLTYIDFATLGILFCLMAVMAGLSGLGFFDAVARTILGRTRSMRQMVLVLVMLCFFFSMVITNDVALMTFVPLAIVMLTMAGPEQKERWLLFTVVMQTIAANLGSMLTPIGNPQNLYLYGLSGMTAGAFVRMMLPMTVLALVLIAACVVLALHRSEKLTLAAFAAAPAMDRKRLLMYGGLFVLSLLTVFHILPWYAVTAVTAVTVFLTDRGTLKRVDYALLLTFVALFVFVGNVGRFPAFYRLLVRIIKGREVLTAVLCSQVASNVPTALLLSRFVKNTRLLAYGVNIGGLGTLIASMASLISYKYVAKDSPHKRGRYLLLFTLYNLIFLFVMLFFTLQFLV